MAAGLVTRDTTCGVWEYSETGLVGLRMSDSDKIRTDPQTYDPHGNPRFKRLKLCPELADGYSWTVHDVPDDVLLQAIREWMQEAQPGDEVTIKLIVMSDDEVEALPEI